MPTALIVLLGVGALLLRAGAVLRAAGSVRSKNAASAVMRTASDFIISTLAFWAIGAAVLEQTHNGFFGFKPGLLFGVSLMDSPGALAILFVHLAVVLIAAGIVTEAISERSRFHVGMATAAVLAAILVPVGAHWAWYGWLKNLGFIDAAGASFIHMAGAIVALVAAYFLGARNGKFNRDGSVNMIPGHNIALTWAGLMITLVAWVPYVVSCVGLHGGELDLAAVNVLLACAGGGLAGLIVSQYRYGKPDVFLVYSGLSAGLVAITAGAGVLSTFSAMVVGFGAGLIVPPATLTLDLRARIDDPSGSITIHGIGGLWGLLATGLLAPGSFTHRLKTLGVQSLGAVAITILCLATGIGLLLALRAIAPLRHTEDNEFDGLDLSEHDINAYPDFQQTMIKSYHLREQ